MQQALKDVYLGLGGNIGNTAEILQSALDKISSIPEVFHLQSSSFYITEPVSDIPQRDYVNAACRFKTSLDAFQLFAHLQTIEKSLGKVPKAKNAPRIIDIDILFFGLEYHHTAELQIPHPRWHERLFVLIPLSDLAQSITVPISANETKQSDLKSLIMEKKHATN